MINNLMYEMEDKQPPGNIVLLIMKYRVSREPHNPSKSIKMILFVI